MWSCFTSHVNCKSIGCYVGAPPPRPLGGVISGGGTISGPGGRGGTTSGGRGGTTPGSGTGVSGPGGDRGGLGASGKGIGCGGGGGSVVISGGTVGSISGIGRVVGISVGAFTGYSGISSFRSVMVIKDFALKGDIEMAMDVVFILALGAK